jgi:hypothetical protein
MPVNEASSEETPYGRYITSDGWFVLNLADALAVRNEEKGGAVYPIEPRELPFGDVGVHVRVLWPGEYRPVRLPWPVDSSRDESRRTPHRRC